MIWKGPGDISEAANAKPVSQMNNELLIQAEQE